MKVACWWAILIANFCTACSFLHTQRNFRHVHRYLHTDSEHNIQYDINENTEDDLGYQPGHFLSGFVTILGNPNVGKSTLMNAILNEKLSIVSAKPQTTRHRILGILTEDTHQLIFSDTPGVLVPAYKLQETMRESVHTYSILPIMYNELHLCSISTDQWSCQRRRRGVAGDRCVRRIFGG